MVGACGGTQTPGDDACDMRDVRVVSSNAQAALNRILAAHEAYFDVERDYAFEGKTFDGYAEFHSTAERYVLVKRAKLWGVSAHEYLFFELVNTLLLDAYERLVEFMETCALKKVKPDAEHMTSYISLVVIADSIEPDVARAVKRTRFRKNFKLGFQGWADLRVAVVDLAQTSIITNAMGKELHASLEANAFGGV